MICQTWTVVVSFQSWSMVVKSCKMWSVRNLSASASVLIDLTKCDLSFTALSYKTHTHSVLSPCSSCRFMVYRAQQRLWGCLMRKTWEVKHVSARIQSQLAQQMCLSSLLSPSRTTLYCRCSRVKSPCRSYFSLLKASGKIFIDNWYETKVCY